MTSMLPSGRRRARLALLGAVSFALSSAALAGSPITATPTSLDFGEVEVGQAAPTQVVTLTNTGTVPYGPVQVGGGAPQDPFTAVQSCQGVTLQPGGTCTFEYGFEPTSPGSFTGISAFVISDAPAPDGGTAFTITLTGRGAGGFTATPLPALSTWALALLAGLVACAGFAATRRT
ncbi:IPTL-CTERM sorting domain-containing protein [Dokdonella sp. MW10]|uniref:IPTL-CTERM sorting domain-containing protein n=1 Tax=Dokdonella sp. MW10 TaxID=2992926 RepID=UPI003F823A1B